MRIAEALWLGLDWAHLALECLGMTLAKVQESAMQLASQERAELLEWLWESLQPEGAARVQERWGVEAQERIDAVDRGELPTVDGPTALKELKRSLSS